MEVVSFTDKVVIIPCIQHGGEHFQAQLRDCQSCGLEGLDEAADESDCNAILQPVPLKFSCLESDLQSRRSLRSLLAAKTIQVWRQIPVYAPFRLLFKSRRSADWWTRE